jgi:hypothetical protein
MPAMQLANEAPQSDGRCGRPRHVYFDGRVSNLLGPRPTLEDPEGEQHHDECQTYLRASSHADGLPTGSRNGVRKVHASW